MSAVRGRRIGLTGGIAAGKSTVSEYLREQGVFVLDADEAARAVVEPGSPGLSALAQRYGEAILRPDGSLHRKALGGIIFSSPEERAAVNALLHPCIIEWMQAREQVYCKEHPGKPVVWDVPLLIETGLHTKMDEVWLVTAGEEARVARLMARDGSSREEAMARMRSQMPQEEKLPYADVVLENDSTKEVLMEGVRAQLARVMGQGPIGTKES